MNSNLKFLGFSLCSALLAVGVYHYFLTPHKVVVNPQPTPIVQTNYTANNKVAAMETTDFTKAAARTIDAVVHITNTSSYRSKTPSNIWEYFGYGPAREYPRIGMGSGVIVAPDGYIITNNHVIEGADQIEVTTNDNRVFNAELVGTDPSSDIAVIKIIGEQSFPYVRFADSDQTKIGEWVLAVGNPYNLNSTVTAGIISAKSRDLNPNDNSNQSFIQTDAAVNSGNSGGALVNTNGDLVGINTAITSNGMGTFIGYSFAVPSNIARKIYEDIIEFGNVQKALLGVSGNGLNARIAEEYNIDVTEGFYVAAVEAEMGAKEAGIQAEDVIVKIDNTSINKFSDMTGYLSSKRPGDRVEVTYLREGKTRTAQVKLKANPYLDFYGMRLKDLSDNEAELYELKEGVKIAQLRNRRLLQRGIQDGNLITGVNGKNIKSTADLRKWDQESIYELEFMNEKGERIRFFFD
ncbi:MAG: trypsin-like peptidase domain-containing protein [Flavobacteriaceae bacterium]